MRHSGIHATPRRNNPTKVRRTPDLPMSSHRRCARTLSSRSATASCSPGARIRVKAGRDLVDRLQFGTTLHARRWAAVATLAAEVLPVLAYGASVAAQMNKGQNLALM